MKYKKIKGFLLLGFFTAYIFSPYANFIGFQKKYEYIEEVHTIKGIIKENLSLESSLFKLPKKISSYSIEGRLTLNQINDFVVFEFENDGKNESKEIEIETNFGNVIKKSGINDDGDERILLDKKIFSDPIFIGNNKNIDYKITSKTKQILENNIKITGVNVSNFKETITINNSNIADAETQDGIISRSEWGADESLRYEDNPKWVAIFKKQAEDANKPKTERQLKQEKRIVDIRQYLAQNFSLQDTPINTILYEGEHKLVWPIEKTKRVEKIFVHHTADSLINDTRDDASIMRAMYYYHNITRGWGDIGYNYVVGRDGKIYEGRAGGDYNVAAHVLRNNKSTVGISVMGNFENSFVPSAQSTGLDRAIGIMAKKYGIDINGNSISHKECQASESCLLKDYSTPNLSGHRDAGYTACPGKNLYSMLGDYKDNGKIYSSGLIYIENKNTSLTQEAISLPKGPNIRIKLSYSGETVEIKSYTDEKMKIQVGNRKGTTKLKYLKFKTKPNGNIALVVGNKSLTVPSFSVSSTVLEVADWKRIPTWDKTGNLNDNKFRGKITIINEDGNLVLINELPLEDYLKGLAEISNQEDEQKAKTILVSARSYAYWYTKPENRKFVGKTNYDGSDDPDVFQKYLGYSYEQRSPNISRYIDDTNSEIILYDSKPIKPWYFNQSSGNTRSYLEYCKLNMPTADCKDIPYLQSVPDPGKTDGTFKGHGVGISGNGAKALADEGRKYDEIIRYFLTGVKIEKINY